MVDTHYEFTAATGVKASCGLCILREGGSTVVVLTELPDNKGMSVTNAAEGIAAQVRREFGLDADQTPAGLSTILNGDITFTVAS